MFGKITQQSIQNTLRNVTNHIGNTYSHVKHIAHHINNGFHAAKQVYRAIEPAVEEFIPQHHNTIHGHVMNAVSGYDNIRNKVLDVNPHTSNIGHKLGGFFSGGI